MTRSLNWPFVVLVVAIVGMVLGASLYAVHAGWATPAFVMTPLGIVLGGLVGRGMGYLEALNVTPPGFTNGVEVATKIVNDTMRPPRNAREDLAPLMELAAKVIDSLHPPPPTTPAPPAPAGGAS